MEQLNRMHELMGRFKLYFVSHLCVFTSNYVLALYLHTSYNDSLFGVVKLPTYIMDGDLGNGAIYILGCNVSIYFDLLSNSLQFK